MPVIKWDSEQTRIVMSEENRRKAVDAAMWLTCSPHEWAWTQEQQELMAMAALYYHQRMSAILSLSSGESIEKEVQP